jgi:MFS transporter, DHA2 family, multidrug resistance protein
VALIAVGLDATVLNLALPTLASALHASEGQLQWFVAAYSLTLAAGLLPGGLLGDRFGRKKIMIFSLVLFGAGSLACAYAPSAGALIAARAVLGVGAAFLITLSLSVITVLFSAEERPRAVGVWAAANFLALPVGPLLGGWLLTHAWWGWVFLVNVPVVLIGLVAVVALLPESRSAVRPGLDPLGTFSSSAGLALMTYGLIEAGQNGWGAAGALAPLFAGILMLLAFVFWERRLARLPGGQPLVDLGLFRSKSFTWGTILAATGIFAMFGVLFTIPQYFQAVVGLDAQGSGLRLLPLIAGVVVGAGLADRLAARFGAKGVVALGFVILAGGLATGATTTVSAGDAFTAAWTAVCGAGVGMALATAASAALSKLSAERSGVGSALMQTVQKVGVPFGVSILGSILNSAYQSNLHVSGLPAAAAQAIKQSVFAGVAVAGQLKSAPLLLAVRTAFVTGMDTMLLVCAAIALVGILLALVFLPRRGVAQASAASVEIHLGALERRRLSMGLLLATLAHQAQQDDADPRLLARLSDGVDGRVPHDVPETQRGRVAAQQILQPLALELILSSLPQPEARARGMGSTNRAKVQIPDS